MGRVIKLFIYFFAYQFLTGAIMIGGYMIANQTTDIPSAEQFMHDHLIWIQLLYALLLTAHLLGWKYVKRSDFSLSFPHTGKVLLTSCHYGAINGRTFGSRRNAGTLNA